MKKITNLRRIGILTLAAVLMFALFGCGDSDEGGNPDKPNNPNLPTELQNTNWIHTSGDRVQFSTNTVTVIPVSGTTRTFTLKSSTTVSELSRTTLYFGDSQTADFIVYQNGTINSVGLGGVQRTGGWSRDTGGGPQPNQCTITFNADGGTVSPASKQVTSGSPAGELPEPEKSPSVFGGWYTAQNGGGTVFTSATIVTTSITVYANWLTATDINNLASFLSAQSGGGSANNPVTLPITIQLTEANWKAILTAIKTAGKYVALDLSTCTRSTTNYNGGLDLAGIFDPIYNFEDGKDHITSLILPNAATSIAGAPLHNNSSSFSQLTSVSALSVIEIGYDAFRDCTSLTSVSFPAATSIGDSAFEVCTSLSSVSFPAATSIGYSAFCDCTSLSSVSFPAATTIGYGAFYLCTSLTSVSFPAATSIGDRAFRDCTSLTSVSFPAATSIGDSAFEVCTSLSSVSFPAATTIGYVAFYNCTSLTSASFPAATSIGKEAFYYTGTSTLTITLGLSAPTLGGGLFYNVFFAKTVTVKVPSGATGYGIIPNTYSGTDTSVNWGNGFRGGGWDGSGFVENSYVNVNITLYVQYQ